MTTRVLVVDDQALLRTAFSSLIDAEDDLEVVGAAADGRQAIELAADLGPDVVVMDVRMPVTDGIQATHEILSERAEFVPRVLILTTFDLDEYVFEALRAGASGFALKSRPLEELLSAIRTVAEGEALLALQALNAAQLAKVFPSAGGWYTWISRSDTARSTVAQAPGACLTTLVSASWTTR